ncbi:hypothetical protein GCM10010466_39290 [Planomonospora alba]|uniref:YCII-related domain-containing protein n=1 Tax=Planomonospora alba TaxID=161354 RepID=A0ABP6NFD9_9ACTN
MPAYPVSTTVEPPRIWAVVLNELVLAGRPCADWWQLYRPRFETSGQVTVLGSGVPGDLIQLGPYDRETADFIRGHLIEHDVPQGAVKIRCWKATP